MAARATLTPPQFKYDIFITPSVLSRRTEAFPVGGGLEQQVGGGGGGTGGGHPSACPQLVNRTFMNY